MPEVEPYASGRRESQERNRRRPKTAPGSAIRVRFRAFRELTPRRVLRQPLYLPAWIGEEFSVETASNISDITTIGAGEWSQLPQNPRLLRRLSGEAMTMTWSPSWMTYQGVNPERVRRELDRIQRHGAVFRLTAAMPRSKRPELEMLATIRSVTRRLPAGEADTRYYNIEIAEYRKVNVGRRGKGGRSGGGRLPTKHKVKANDTLRRVAEHYYHSASGWRTIARANGLNNLGGSDKIVSSKKVKVGDRITIPRAPAGQRGRMEYGPTEGEMEHWETGLLIGED